MRKYVSDLIANSQCILITENSYLFVNDFEKYTYKELFFQEQYEDGSKTNIKDIILNGESRILLGMMERNMVVYGYEPKLKEPAYRCHIFNEITRKKNFEEITTILDSFSKLDRPSREIILEECKRIHERRFLKSKAEG